MYPAGLSYIRLIVLPTDGCYLQIVTTADCSRQMNLAAPPLSITQKMAKDVEASTLRTN